MIKWLLPVVQPNPEEIVAQINSIAKNINAGEGQLDGSGLANLIAKIPLIKIPFIKQIFTEF